MNKNKNIIIKIKMNKLQMKHNFQFNNLMKKLIKNKKMNNKIIRNKFKIIQKK